MGYTLRRHPVALLRSRLAKMKLDPAALGVPGPRDAAMPVQAQRFTLGQPRVHVAALLSRLGQLEPAHAVAWLLANPGPGGSLDLVTLSGRGDKDLAEVLALIDAQVAATRVVARRPRSTSSRRDVHATIGRSGCTPRSASTASRARTPSSATAT